MRRHILAVPLSLALLGASVSIANACTPGMPWYQPCGWFGTVECVCDCSGYIGPTNCRPIADE